MADIDMTHKTLMIKLSVIIGILNIGSMAIAALIFTTYVAKWQQSVDSRLAQNERDIQDSKVENREQTKYMIAQTKEVAILSERLRTLIEMTRRQGEDR